MDQLCMVSSDIESHFFPPLQDENAKLSEELVSTKTDLSAQLAQCEEVQYMCILCIYMYICHRQYMCTLKCYASYEADVKCKLLWGYIQHFW